MGISKISPEKGKTYMVRFPFTIGEYSGYGESGGYSEKTWIPGGKVELEPPDSVTLISDGEGYMVLTVVDVHKPGKYPTRIFYTRKWIDPDGKEFGSGKLFITTESTFRRRAEKYHYEYSMSGDAPVCKKP